MKHLLKMLLSFLFAVCCFSALAQDAVNAERKYADIKQDMLVLLAENGEEVCISAQNVTDAGHLLPSEESHGYGDAVVQMNANDNVSFCFSVPKTGGYLMRFSYYIPESYMQNLLLSMQIDGVIPFYECRNLVLRAAWQDTSQEYSLDSSGNEMYPLPERKYEWQEAYLNSATYHSDIPFIFYLEEGTHELTLANNDVPVLIGGIYLTGNQELMDTEDYLRSIDGAACAQSSTIVIEGEKYTGKSDSYVRPERGSNVAYSPYDAAYKRINALSETSWQQPGQWVEYTFDIEEEGLYYLAFKYEQSSKEDMPSLKTIYLDGEICFRDAAGYPFPYTGNQPKIEIIHKNDVNIGFYLTAGTHTLRLESVSGEYEQTHKNLYQVIDSIASLSLNIQYVTGNRTDENRDWKLESYIPNICETLLSSSDIVEKEYENLSRMTNIENPVLLSDLQSCVRRLRIFAEDLNYLVNHLEQFSSGEDAVSSYIANVTADLLNQPMSIDQIYLTADVETLPDTEVGFFTSLKEELKKLILSIFGNEKTKASDKKTLTVWVNHASTNVEIIRQLTEASYLPDADFDIELSVMADESKLLLAVAAGNAPDAVIGLSYYQPYQLALRSALYDLTEFDSFPEVLDDYEDAFFIPFAIEDKCYGLPEALNFNLLFYRKDILSQLGLEVPATWDDVQAMLPVLAQYGMSFCTRIATDSSLKTLGSTYPFIDQMGASIFAEDGLSCALGSEEGVAAFRMMCDLYTKYSLPTTVANFYNSFKNGSTPIGIGDMTIYILLRNAAPEIAGQWGIAPIVGIRQEDGSINNSIWAVNTASSILAGSDMKEEAWDYLKWFMSTDVQTQYVNNMQLTFGPEFIWASANLKAFTATTAYSKEDMDVIMEQLRSCSEIGLHPSYVIAQRAISDAWNRVVFDGDASRTALDQAISTINRDITKKLKEFGYIDKNGTVLSPYMMPTLETVNKWKGE